MYQYIYVAVPDAILRGPLVSGHQTLYVYIYIYIYFLCFSFSLSLYIYILCVYISLYLSLSMYIYIDLIPDAILRSPLASRGQPFNDKLNKCIYIYVHV